MPRLDSENLVSLFRDQAEQLGDRPFLWAKHDGEYRPLSWADVARQVAAVARGLHALGVEPGDRVGLVAENRPEWLIADVAIMAAGGITVPAYTTNTEADHRHILEDSGAKGVIVSTRRLARSLLPAAARSAATGFIVTMDSAADSPAQATQGIEMASWGDMIADSDEEPSLIDQAARSLGRDDVACIIYTSGTGGQPKGVMLHHGSILHNCRGAYDALHELGLDDEVFLSFLPLSHSYEHTAGQFFPIAIGAQIYYADGVDTLATNMVEMRPTVMTAVPRLYEVLHQRILRGVRKAGGFRERLFIRALELGRRKTHGQALGLVDRIADAVVDRLVRDKVRAQFGGRLKGLVSGGAPLNPEIGIFFTALGLRVMQGYGQTEAGPVISVNRPHLIKMDTVGPPMKDTEVRIAEDGEILVRGELVMRGYWRNEQATAETIIDGWLHTGDVGEIDADGYIRITDRKKDIIVNSGGDNIAPQRVEGVLTMEPEIAQAMVYGDRRPHLVALLVPDPDWLANWARMENKTPDLRMVADEPGLHQALAQTLERVNERLSTIEKVRRFIVAGEPFTVENGQLTPTMKARRHVLTDVYGDALSALYR